MSLPDDGISLRPISCGSRVVHEGTNGYWAHGQIRVGADVSAAVWNFNLISKQQTCVGFGRDDSLQQQADRIDCTEVYNDWLGMSVWFKLDSPGHYQLKLRPYSEHWFVAELIFEQQYSSARYRYLAKGKAPYHLVALVQTEGDWIDSEPPCTWRMVSSICGCSCVCANAYPTADALCLLCTSSAQGQDETCANWDAPHLRLHAFRNAAK